MEPFSIACTTCRARLKVRDPAAIGQILACPKCGSMVLIEAPAGMTLPKFTTSPGASPGAPRIQVSDSDSLADTVSGSFDDLDAVVSEKGSGPTRTVVSQSLPIARPLSQSAAAPALAPTTAPAEVSPAAVRQLRQVLLLVGAACLGSVLAVVLFAAVVSWWGKRTHVATGTTPGSTSTNDAATNDTATNDTAAADAAPDTDAALPPTVVPNSDATPAAPNEPAKTNDDPSPPESPAKEPIPPDEKPPTPPAPGDAPPDLKPKAAAEPAAGFAGLDKFEELLTGRPRAKPKDADTAPAEPEKPNGDEPSAEPSIPRPPQRIVHVAARLADKLPRIEYAAPLADFIQEMSNLSNVPISFDMPALVAKQVDLNQTVKINETNTTLQKALTAALAPLKLGLVAGENHLLVTWPAGETTNSREVKLAVPDLVGDDPQRLESLGEWIVQLIAPESWEPAGGTGSLTTANKTLVVTHNDAVQQQVALFCDKLRQARELPPKKMNAAWLKSVSLATRATDKLAKPVTLNFSRPTNFPRILDRLAKATGTRIVVDWKAVAEVGWNPDAMVTFTVANEPLPAALALLLEPMDLTFRVIDESTLQITTSTALAGALDIEFHPSADLAKDNPPALIERIKESLGENLFRDGGGLGVLEWDAPSKSLLAALSPPQQQALAEFLEAARAEK